VVLRRLREWLLEAHAAAAWGDAAALEQLLRCDGGGGGGGGGDGRWRLLRRDAALFADLAHVRSPLEGRTLAHAAALAANHAVGALEVALAWGADVDALDRMGQGALHLAIGAAADAQLPVAMRVLAASAHAPRMLRRADAEGRAPLDVALDGHLCWCEVHAAAEGGAAEEEEEEEGAAEGAAAAAAGRSNKSGSALPPPRCAPRWPQSLSPFSGTVCWLAGLGAPSLTRLRRPADIVGVVEAIRAAEARQSPASLAADGLGGGGSATAAAAAAAAAAASGFVGAAGAAAAAQAAGMASGGYGNGYGNGSAAAAAGAGVARSGAALGFDAVTGGRSESEAYALKCNRAALLADPRYKLREMQRRAAAAQALCRAAELAPPGTSAEQLAQLVALPSPRTSTSPRQQRGRRERDGSREEADDQSGGGSCSSSSSSSDGGSEAFDVYDGGVAAEGASPLLSRANTYDALMGRIHKHGRKASVLPADRYGSDGSRRPAASPRSARAPTASLGERELDQQGRAPQLATALWRERGLVGSPASSRAAEVSAVGDVGGAACLHRLAQHWGSEMPGRGCGWFYRDDSGELRVSEQRGRQPVGFDAQCGGCSVPGVAPAPAPVAADAARAADANAAVCCRC
jgi:hypothetical protein